MVSLTYANELDALGTSNIYSSSKVHSALSVILVTALCTIVGMFLSQFLDHENVIMIYLLGVVFLACRCGLVPALCACALSVITFDLFIVPPIFQFVPYDPQFFFTFAMMFVIAIVMSGLTHRVKDLALYAQVLGKQAELLNLTSDAIVVWDLETTRVAYWNSGASRMYGWAKEAMVGKKEHVLLSGQLPMPLSVILADLRSSGVWHGEIQYAKPDGRQIIVSCHWRLTANADKGRTKVVEFAADVTAQHTARTALLSARDELEQRVADRTEELTRLNRQLAHARDEAQAASKLKSEFVANMSHEIRTPMGGIIGMTNVLRHTALDPEQRSYTEAISEASNSLLTVVNDILDFSKIEAGKLKMEVSDFDLVQLFESVCQLLETTAQQRGLELTAKIDPKMPLHLRGDVNRLRQILINLVGNAIKFSDRGKVRLCASCEQLPNHAIRVRFSVEDQGTGLTVEEQSRLWQPFVQGDGSLNRKHGGTGLGLSICKRLVELMGGNVGVESIKGIGSTFFFSVPLTLQADDADCRPDKTTVESLPGRSNRQKNATKCGTILVVEDYAINKKVAQIYLSELGFQTHIVSNGKEALDAMATQDFGLVLMDCQMPELDGLAATRTIRERESQTGKRVAIIAVTAHAMEGDRERCLSAGMDDYISKPIDPIVLRRITDTWLPLAEEAVCEAATIIDVELLKSQYGDRAQELLHIFVQDTATALDSIEKALGAGNDSEEVFQLIHGLKGNCATISASCMKDHCAALEIALQANDREAALSLLHQLRQQFTEVLNFAA